MVEVVSMSLEFQYVRHECQGRKVFCYVGQLLTVLTSLRLRLVSCRVYGATLRKRLDAGKETDKGKLHSGAEVTVVGEKYTVLRTSDAAG